MLGSLMQLLWNPLGHLEQKISEPAPEHIVQMSSLKLASM